MQSFLNILGYQRMLLLLVVALVMTTTVQAQDSHSHKPQYDVYQLSASAQADVPNDLMTATLVAQATGTDAAELANKVNAMMGWAVSKLKPYTNVETQTLDYQTRPQYEKKGTRIKGWVASQSIQLESEDFEQAGKAIQLLQEKLLVQGMHLTARPTTRKLAENQLINTALEEFKERALLVQTNMGAPAYRVMNLSINTNGSGGWRPKAGNYRSDMAEMSVSSAPAIEAGTSQITVTINGQVQLQ